MTLFSELVFRMAAQQAIVGIEAIVADAMKHPRLETAGKLRGYLDAEHSVSASKRI